MKAIRAVGLFAAVLFIFLGIASLSPKETRAAEDAAAAIKTLIDGFTAAFNNHDARALSMWFTEDADFINVQQAVSHSRKGIEDHFVPLFSGRLKSAHRTYMLKNIRSVALDVASVTMDYTITDTMGANGEALPPRKGLYDWIVVKQNGKWLISILHESELASEPAIVPVR